MTDTAHLQISFVRLPPRRTGGSESGTRATGITGFECDPPLLIFHDRTDEAVSIGQSERMADVDKKAKLPVTFHVLEKSGHGGDRAHSGESRTRVVEILGQHHKPKR